MSGHAADGRPQGNHRRHAIRHLRSGGQRNSAAQAVSDEVNLPATNFTGLLNRLVYMPPD